MLEQPRTQNVNIIVNQKGPGKAILVIALVVLVVIIAIYTTWSKKSGPVPTGQAPITQEEQVKQAISLLGQSGATFSPVSKLVPIAEKDVSAEFKELVLGESNDVVYNSVQYANGQKGFLASYTIKISNPSLRDIITMVDSNTKSWLRTNSSYSREFGYVDFSSSKTKAFARVMIFPNEDNTTVKVTVKSENIK